MLINQNLGEEVVRDSALLIIFERRAQMFFRTRVAAAKERGHFVIPSSKSAVRRPLLEASVDSKHRFELLLHRFPVLEAGAQAKGLGERAHIGGRPEMA